MNVPSAFTLDEGSLELSPTWQSQFSKATLGTGASAREIQQVQSNLELRLTFGLPSQWELGFAVGAGWLLRENHSFTMDSVAIGFRKDIVRKGETWALNVQGGLFVPFHQAQGSVVLDLAIAQSYKPWSWLQVDVSVGGQYQSTQQAIGGVRYDIGVGAFVVPDKLQLIAEWSHAWTFQNEISSEGLLGMGVNWNVSQTGTLTLGVLLSFAQFSSAPESVAFVSYAHVFQLPKPSTSRVNNSALASRPSVHRQPRNVR